MKWAMDGSICSTFSMCKLKVLSQLKPNTTNTTANGRQYRNVFSALQLAKLDTHFAILLLPLVHLSYCHDWNVRDANQYAYSKDFAKMWLFKWWTLQEALV